MPEKKINGYTHTELKVREEEEQEILIKVNKQFERNFVKSPKRYDTFDGTDEEYLVEIKCRNVKKEQYPDTLIGANKIKKLTIENKLLCIFKFLDGDFYYWWNADDNNFITDCGLNSNPRPHHHISTKLLKSF